MTTLTAGRRIGMHQLVLSVLGLLVIGLALEAIIGAKSFLTLDTLQVLDGVGVLDRCAKEHVYSHCDGRFGAVNPFPAAQYLMGLGLKHAGDSYAQAANFLIWISRVAALGILVLAMLAGRYIAGRAGMLTMALVVITGPVLWYSQLGFAESLAMFLILWMVVAVIRQRSWQIAIAVSLAALTKETAAVFLIPLGATVILAQRRPLMRGLLPVVSGAAAGVLVNVLFNVWRYGTLYNDYYAEPGRITPGIGLKVQFFAGQLAAPNAGLLWFWPVALVVMTLAVVSALRSPPEGDRRPVLMWLATFAGLLAIFASYHSPYGWNAWGPRYLVPWIPALCVAALTVADRDLPARVASSLRRPLVWCAVFVVTVALALPQLGAFINPDLAMHLFDDTRPPCYYVAPDALEAWEHSNFYDCTTHLAWGAKSIELHALRGLRSPHGVVLSVLMASAVGGLLFGLSRAGPAGRPA